ncbi:MAG TPA: hypothetical protein PLB09_12600, partial [Deltaproteobacteria bacterium]|nr:hypothetical protein [Deltaproteobacteria bacterium]
DYSPFIPVIAIQGRTCGNNVAKVHREGSRDYTAQPYQKIFTGTTAVFSGHRTAKTQFLRPVLR